MGRTQAIFVDWINKILDLKEKLVRKKIEEVSGASEKYLVESRPKQVPSYA